LCVVSTINCMLFYKYMMGRIPSQPLILHTVSNPLFPQLEGEYCSSSAQLLQPGECEYPIGSVAQLECHFTRTLKVAGSNTKQSNTNHDASLCREKLEWYSGD